MTRSGLSRPVAVACILVLALSAACSVGAEPIDLDDPDLLSRLDVEEPTDIQWERAVRNVPIAGTTPRASPSELELIGAGLAEIPRAMIERTGLQTIFRVDGSDDVTSSSQEVAFARGANMYLVDQTFGDGLTRLDMASILAHELAHVAQFNQLVTDDVAGLLENGARIDPIAGSQWVRDYAEDVGWRDLGSDRLRPDWRLSDRSGITPYGMTAPEEDMAEAFARVVLGRTEEISEDRIRWLEEWLDLDRRVFTEGKPYVPAGAQQTSSRSALYDEAAVARLGKRHVDELYYLLPSQSAETDTLVMEIQDALSFRKLAGALTRTEDPRLPRFSGQFLRGDGVVIWVELWDFRASSGIPNAPDQPLLAYVMAW